MTRCSPTCSPPTAFAVDDYPSHLLRALRNAAATNEADPTVVVLTPGPSTPPTSSIRCWPGRWVWNWSRGPDLFCRDNAVYMRTTAGERQVDVIYRRIDDVLSTPCSSGPTQCLGWLAYSTRRAPGNVVISSAVGNGVGDDKLVYTYVPTMIDYYLGRSRYWPTSTRCAAGSMKSARRFSTASRNW